MEQPDLLAERPRYTDKVVPFIGNGNAKVITGIRRCGKSSVLRLLRGTLGSGANVIAFNMELAENNDLREWKAFLDAVMSSIDPLRKNFLLVDEIQDIPGWEMAVRDLIARGSCDIYITGSNSNLLSSEYSTYLGGRFNRLHMFPLSYAECLRFRELYGGEGDVLERFIRVGGFPNIWCHPVGVESCMQTVRDIIDVSIVRDIESRYAIRNKALLMDLLRFALSTLGKYVSTNNMYNTLRSSGTRVSADTVYEFLGYLEAANILIRAETFDIRGRRVLSSKHKYYVTDLGIKHAVLGYRPEDVAAHMENIIFTELLGRGYRVYVGDERGREIDFVAEKGDRRIYVQACSSLESEAVMAREFGNLEAIGDSFPKYVVLMDAGVYAGTTASGIICCGLREFLTTELP